LRKHCLNCYFKHSKLPAFSTLWFTLVFFLRVLQSFFFWVDFSAIINFLFSCFIKIKWGLLLKVLGLSWHILTKWYLELFLMLDLNDLVMLPMSKRAHKLDTDIRWCTACVVRVKRALICRLQYCQTERHGILVRAAC